MNVVLLIAFGGPLLLGSPKVEARHAESMSGRFALVHLFYKLLQYQTGGRHVQKRGPSFPLYFSEWACSLICSICAKSHHHAQGIRA